MANSYTPILCINIIEDFTGKSLRGPHTTDEVPESPYRWEGPLGTFLFLFLSFSDMVDIDHSVSQVFFNI